MSGFVLVMTDTEDYTSDLIIAALRDRGAEVMRFDPGSGPICMETCLSGSRWLGLAGDAYRSVRLEEVRSVLWRWPAPPAGHPDIAEVDRRAWAAREDSLALYGILKTLPARWVNHPDRAALVDNSKPGQLITATSCGLSVPDTLITTSGEQVRSWGRSRDVLYKAFRAQGSDGNGMVAATRADLAALPTELGAASMFQEVAVGPSVRVTVVGDQVFAVEISGTDELDWRPFQNLLTFTPIRVPETIRAGVRSFMGRYHLEYGAMDFIRSADTGAWTFLECNARGMYGFVEIQSGLQITAAIADHLCHSVRSGSRTDDPMEG